MSLSFEYSSGLTKTNRLNSIHEVLTQLANNTNKLISPKEVRDAFLTSWSNSIFKITHPDSHPNYPYIGIDTNKPSNKDFKHKMLLGKRSFGGLDVMNTTLLGSINDTDIFFYNTKDDLVNNDSTKLSILAGVDSNYHSSAPYIESKKTGTEIDLNIKNPNGNININSTTGRISVNNVNFPTLSENNTDIADGKVLRYVGTYPNGKFEWVTPAVTTTSIGSSVGTTTITGPSVTLNGYNLEFVEDAIVTKTIGGVNQGDNFEINSFNGQKWPMTEVIRKLLYPYVKPEFDISVNNLTLGVDGGVYAEVGVPSNIEISYDVTIFSYDVEFKIENTTTPSLVHDDVLDDYSINNRPGHTSISPGANKNSSVSPLSAPATLSSPGPVIFKLTVTELPTTITPTTTQPIPHPTSEYVKEVSIKFIDPIYYGFSRTEITDSALFTDFALNDASKLIKPYYTDEYYEVDYGDFNIINDSLNEPSSPNNGDIHLVGYSSSDTPIGSITSPTNWSDITGGSIVIWNGTAWENLSGYLYFAYPNTTDFTSATLSEIKDPNGYIIHDVNSLSLSSFEDKIINRNTTGAPYQFNYTVYKTKLPTTLYGPSTFKFKF